MQRRAERGTVVAGGRLHVDFVEQAGASQLSVGTAIQRDAASQCDFAESGARTKMTADMENRAIQCRLQSCGNITMSLGDVVAGLAPGNQVARQPVARLQVVLALVAR